MSEAKILNLEQTVHLRYPIPDSMIRAAGLLRGKKNNALNDQKKMRKEWDKRLQRQVKLAFG